MPDHRLDEGNLQEALIQEGPNGYSPTTTSGNAWSRGFLESVLPLPEGEFITCADAYLLALAPDYGPVK